MARDLRAAIQAGRLIALTAVIGAGKTVLSRRLRDDLEREGRVIVSRALTVEKFEAGVKPIDAAIVETVLSRQIHDLEPQLTRHGYDVRALCDQFDAKPAEIRQLLRGGLNPQRSAELIDEMRAAGLPL